MKAIQIKKYQKNLQTQIVDIAIPQISDDEVLVKVMTAWVNPLDIMVIRGEVKLITPYNFPLTLWNEFAWIIEKVGKNVKNFSVWERVFARLPLDQSGAFAEYVSIHSQEIAKIPDYLDWKEAGAIPLVGLTAMQALDLLALKKWEKIFISWATGWLGHILVSVAKSFGLQVFVSGNISGKERLEQLWIDGFFDYKKEDYSKVLKNMDGIIDTIWRKETEKQFSILKQWGNLVSLKWMPNFRFACKQKLWFLQKILFGLAGLKLDLLAKKNNQKYHFMFVHSSGKQLADLAKIFEKNQIKPNIDAVFSFEKIDEALEKVANGKSNGKTIISFMEK